MFFIYTLQQFRDRFRGQMRVSILIDIMFGPLSQFPRQQVGSSVKRRQMSFALV